MRRRWRWRCVVAAILTAVTASSCDLPFAGSETGDKGLKGVLCQWATVRYVSDGDTIRVDLDGGAEDERVRYIGIDTPEIGESPGRPEPFAEEARNRNEQLAGGKRVCLEKDVSETDRFGRLLRYAWLEDGRLVNEVLAREGWAVLLTIPPDVKYADRFLAAERAARDAEAGRWAE